MRLGRSCWRPASSLRDLSQLNPLMSKATAKYARILILPFLLSSLVVCSSRADEIFTPEPTTPNISDQIDLPPGWEAFETIDNRYGGQDTSIVTDLGSLVSIHSAPLNTFDKHSAKEYFLKLHLTSALYSEELQNAAKINFGEVDRGKYTGLYARIKVPEPYSADVTIEVFYVETPNSENVVVFNTPQELIDSVGKMHSEFLYVINDSFL